GAAAQLVPVTFLERPQVAFRGVKEDSDRLRMQLLLRPKLAVKYDIASLLACHREARLDAQSVAVELPSAPLVGQPDRRRHDPELFRQPRLSDTLDPSRRPSLGTHLR